jgi:hypothetical protein
MAACCISGRKGVSGKKRKTKQKSNDTGRASATCLILCPGAFLLTREASDVCGVVIPFGLSLSGRGGCRDVCRCGVREAEWCIYSRTDQGVCTRVWLVRCAGGAPCSALYFCVEA